MILPLFFSLVALCFGLIVIGKYHDAPVYSILGFVLMFLLGVYLIQGEIAYAAGENVQNTHETYGENDTVVVASQTITTTYSNWEGDTILGLDLKFLIGVYLAIASIMGFISVITQQKTTNIVED